MHLFIYLISNLTNILYVPSVCVFTDHREMIGSESSSSPVLDEHGSAQWCQFLCCHQLADEGMTLWVQTAGLRRVAEQVRQELVMLGYGAADVLLPEGGRVAVQLHRATAGRAGKDEEREGERAITTRCNAGIVSVKLKQQRLEV